MTYNEIQKRVAYTLQYGPYYIWDFPETPDNRKKLEKKTVYRVFFTLLKAFLLIAGSCALITLVLGLIYNFGSHSEVLGNIASVTGITIPISLIISLIVGGVGAIMESHSEKKDKKIRVRIHSKTWVLQSGKIVVSNELGDGGTQMLGLWAINNTALHMPRQAVPFSRMEIIDKVHSFYISNGKIIADVDKTVLYLNHPYTNEEANDDVEHYYNYYWKNERGNIMWYDNIKDKEILFNALQALQK